MTHEELATKAKGATSAEELLSLAKENGFELTKEEAEFYLKIKETGELSHEALSKVSGGAVYSRNHLIVTNFHSCHRWQWDKCGKNSTKRMNVLENTSDVHVCYDYKNGCGMGCGTCKWEEYRFPFQICTHPETRK